MLEDDVVVDRGDMAAAAYVLLQGLECSGEPGGGKRQQRSSHLRLRAAAGVLA